MVLVTYLWSIAVASEIWTLGEAEKDRGFAKCGATENVKWMDRITNEEVIEKIRKKRTMWKI